MAELHLPDLAWGRLCRSRHLRLLGELARERAARFCRVIERDALDALRKKRIVTHTQINALRAGLYTSWALYELGPQRNQAFMGGNYSAVAVGHNMGNLRCWP